MPNLFKFSISIILVVLTASCSDSILSHEELEMPCRYTPVAFRDFTYPNSPDYRPCGSRAASNFDTDWENVRTIEFSTGDRIPAPWAESTLGDLTDPYKTDVMKEDGWTLVCHNFDRDPKLVRITPWFMSFHNIRTGEFKFFSYEENGSPINNNAHWIIGFEKPQGLLNFTQEVAIPSSHQFRNVKDYMWTCPFSATYNSG